MAQITLSRPKRSQPKAWVAQITGPDPTYRLARVVSVPANLEAYVYRSAAEDPGDDYVVPSSHGGHTRPSGHREPQFFGSRPTNGDLLLDEAGVLQLAAEFLEILSIYEIRE
jgi:hypothetical protein